MGDCILAEYRVLCGVTETGYIIDEGGNTFGECIIIDYFVDKINPFIQR